MTKSSDDKIRRGTGNIFADLGFPDPETHLLKAGLVSQLGSVIKAQKLSQTNAAALTGLSQPDISRLLRGQFRDVSVERIMRMLTRLGCDIDVTIKPAQGAGKKQTIQLQSIPG